MYKRSMPISFRSVNEQNMAKYLETLKKCKADRVFICGFGYHYVKDSFLYTNTKSIKNIISFFKENGLEVGAWIDGFGHGASLVGEGTIDKDRYQSIVGIDGKSAPHAICPADKNFISDYTSAIKLLASLNPDLIMIDDDFRINGRSSYYLGCFCPYHLQKFYSLVQEEVPLEDIEKLITTGEKNKYRDAYFDMIGETLLDFAKAVRSAIDEVNPNIRAGLSSPFETLDTCGTKLYDVQKALAGNTRPFSRISGAPYWSNNIIAVTEGSRLEFSFRKDVDIELFAEGDTYPRPRYNVPSRPLELFEFMLLASGDGDGILSYIFDYLSKPEYETGYAERFIRNENVRTKILEIFNNKTSVGVRVFCEPQKVRNYSMPSEVIKKSFNYFSSLQPFTPAVSILSANSIPTCYENTDYPVLVYGENAKYIDLSELTNGVITDVEGAKILQSRGVDVGLISSEDKAFDKEYYIDYDGEICAISHPNTSLIKVSEKTVVESLFLPDETPASYRYENKDGIRFFVMAFNYHSFIGDYNANYLKNYYRQQQVISACKWLANKPLPATTTKHPSLYLLPKKSKNGDMAIAISNLSVDDVYDCIINLDGNYEIIDGIDFSGKIVENTLKIDRIEPFGFTAVNLKKV